MKKEMPQGVMWGIIAVVAIGAIAMGMNYLNGAAGNNEPSEELVKQQAEATAARYSSGAPQSPPKPNETGEAAAREAYRAQNPEQSSQASGE